MATSIQPSSAFAAKAGEGKSEEKKTEQGVPAATVLGKSLTTPITGGLFG
jgi:hypothetical protein